MLAEIGLVMKDNEEDKTFPSPGRQTPLKVLQRTSATKTRSLTQPIFDNVGRKPLPGGMKRSSRPKAAEVYKDISRQSVSSDSQLLSIMHQVKTFALGSDLLTSAGRTMHLPFPLLHYSRPCSLSY